MAYDWDINIKIIFLDRLEGKVCLNLLLQALSFGGEL